MKININIPEPEQAYTMLRSNIVMLKWALKNNRPYQMEFYKNLNNPIINSMIEDTYLLEEKKYIEYNKRHFNLFVRELYPNCGYDDIANSLLENIAQLEQVLPKFKALNESWGFKLFDQYNINLDYFSSGGKYNSSDGSVKLGINTGQVNIQVAIFIAIHEMVHLGIEENIVQKYNLPQEEKERIVDNLCIYVTEGIINCKLRTDSNGLPTPYQKVAECAFYMDDVVGKQPENNLDDAIKALIANKSIKRYFE